MKKLLIGLLLLGSASAFADDSFTIELTSKKCSSAVVGKDQVGAVMATLNRLNTDYKMWDVEGGSIGIVALSRREKKIGLVESNKLFSSLGVQFKRISTADCFSYDRFLEDISR